MMSTKRAIQLTLSFALIFVLHLPAWAQFRTLPDDVIIVEAIPNLGSRYANYDCETPSGRKVSVNLCICPTTSVTIGQWTCTKTTGACTRCPSAPQGDTECGEDILPSLGLAPTPSEARLPDEPQVLSGDVSTAEECWMLGGTEFIDNIDSDATICRVGP